MLCHREKLCHSCMVLLRNSRGQEGRGGLQHRDPSNEAKRDINKILLHNMDANMGQVISDFWDKDKNF